MNKQNVMQYATLGNTGLASRIDPANRLPTANRSSAIAWEILRPVACW
jgi:hypothetical protein